MKTILTFKGRGQFPLGTQNFFLRSSLHISFHNYLVLLEDIRDCVVQLMRVFI